jgi:SAM-dependent methyltransferase
MNRKHHWNTVYETKPTDDLSWTQLRPALSLELIESAGLAKDAPILDVGGGTSTLVDSLVELGYTRLSVLDLSGAALAHNQARLGSKKADRIEWIESDITAFTPSRKFQLWHDRAVFHFLTDPVDRKAYVETLRNALEPGGTIIIATFALDGPPKCSGLDVARYDEHSIATEIGPEFRLQETRRETHVTPWGSEQRFVYFRFRCGL